MQPDGNLVLRSRVTNALLWQTNTAGNPLARAVLRSDGNLAVVRSDQSTAWSAAVTPGPNAKLKVLNSGQVRVETSTAGVAFSSSEPLFTNPSPGPFTTGISIRRAPGHAPSDQAALVDTTPSTPGVFTDAPLAPGAELVDVAGDVRIRHNGFDAAGNAKVSISSASQVAPPIPASPTLTRVNNTVTVTFTHLGTSTARFELGRSTSPSATSNVQVVSTAPPTARSMSELNRTEGVWYYRVRAVGVNNVVGAWSERTVPATIDWTAPTPPTGVTAQSVPGGIRLAWSPSTDATSGIWYYRVRRNGQVVSSPASSSREVVVGAGPANSIYEIEAVDLRGNVSPRAEVVK
jgi:hypothetical protein